MPVSKERQRRYPGGSFTSGEWLRIREWILLRSAGACEGSPAFPTCRAVNGKAHPVTGSKVVLTIAHLDHDPGNSVEENLRAWCQRCHLCYDAERHAQNRARNAREALVAEGQASLF